MAKHDNGIDHEYEGAWEEVELDNLDASDEDGTEIEQNGPEEEEVEIVDEDESGQDGDAPEQENPPEDQKPEEEAAEAEEGEAEEKEDKPKGDKRRKSRSVKRIKQLIEQREKIQAELEEARKAKEELEAKVSLLQKNSSETRLKDIDSLMETKRKQMAQAMRDGDIDAQLQLNDDIQELHINKRIAQAEQDKYSSSVKKVPEQPDQKPQEQEQLDPRMQQWLNDNPWFFEDKSRQKAVVDYSNELVKQGITDKHPEFFMLVDEFIEDEFGDTDSDSVQLNKSSGEKTENPPSSKRKTQQPAVAGASRTPVSRKNRVTLSPEEKQMAKSLGLSLEDYAASKVKYKDSQDGQWVEII